MISTKLMDSAWLELEKSIIKCRQLPVGTVTGVTGKIEWHQLSAMFCDATADNYHQEISVCY
jgi:hypothetical protein